MKFAIRIIDFVDLLQRPVYRIINSGLIRLGCWAAILVYGYILVTISVWCLSWIGLAPTIPTISKFYPLQYAELKGIKYGLKNGFEFIDGEMKNSLDNNIKIGLTALSLLFHHLSPLGPSALLISFCLSLKKHKTSFSICAKLFVFWAMMHYLSSVSVVFGMMADLGFVGLTVGGLIRVLCFSFSTAQVLAPTVAVVLVDLQRLRVE